MDNNLIIDAWKDQPPTEYRVTRSVNSGHHDIKVEYYERGGGAVAQFRWQQASGSNLARGKPAYARSVQLGDESRFGPRKAADGNLSTRWSSRQRYEGGQDWEWIWVSLEGWYNINRVVLKWEAAYAKRYNIYVWDGSQWIMVNRNTDGRGGVETRTFSSRNTCCVLLVGERKVNSSWGYSLWEFEAYGSGASSTADPESINETNDKKLPDPVVLPEHLQ
jgi:hypothetical protein